MNNIVEQHLSKSGGSVVNQAFMLLSNLLHD